jgi:transcriptional regulator with XRE-family HTH domain
MRKPRETEIRRIGRHIRLLRETSGRTLDQVAAASGLSVRALRELELGNTNPTLATVVSAAEALGVSVDEIVAAARRDQPAADLTRANEARKKTDLALTRTLPEPRMRARLIDLSAGLRSGLPAGAAFVHVLTGSLTATLDGETVQLGPGDSFHAQPGVLRELEGQVGQLLLVEATASALSQQEQA